LKAKKKRAENVGRQEGGAGQRSRGQQEIETRRKEG